MARQRGDGPPPGRAPGFGLVVTDFNGDDKPDIAASNYADDSVSILLNTCGSAM